MVRYLIGSLLSAALLFFWGFLFWGVSPFPYLFMHRFADEDEVTQVLKKNAPLSGAYFLPFPSDAASSDAEAHKAMLARHREGPLVSVQYNKEGVDVENPLMYLFGFGQILLASLLVGFLLWLAVPNLKSYPLRVLFVFLAGTFACSAITLAEPIWFHHPWEGVLNVAVHHLVGWFLAGLVMALLIRPRPATAV